MDGQTNGQKGNLKQYIMDGDNWMKNSISWSDTQMDKRVISNSISWTDRKTDKRVIGNSVSWKDRQMDKRLI